MNLRPSGYEPDELPGCSTPRCVWYREETRLGLVYGSGGDLLSHGLSRSTIGAAGLNGRVREGIGCFPCAVTAGPANQPLAACWQRGCFDLSKLCQVMDEPRWSGGPTFVGRLPGRIKPIERLVLVDCACRHACIPSLSTWWSSTALRRDLVLRGASRLDAFSGYPVRS